MKSTRFPFLTKTGLCWDFFHVFLYLGSHHFKTFFQHPFTTTLGRFWTPTWTKDPWKVDPRADIFKVRSYKVRFSIFWGMYWTECMVLRSRGFQKYSQNRPNVKKNRIEKTLVFRVIFETTFLQIFTDFGALLGAKMAHLSAKMEPKSEELECQKRAQKKICHGTLKNLKNRPPKPPKSIPNQRQI